MNSQNGSTPSKANASPRHTTDAMVASSMEPRDSLRMPNCITRRPFTNAAAPTASASTPKYSGNSAPVS